MISAETVDALAAAMVRLESLHDPHLRGSDIPTVDVATASFPCTDLSVAGNRAGLAGAESGLFWEFARLLGEMAERRPPVVLLENVLGFANSHGGEDLRTAVRELNRLGYFCDVIVADASWFVPQSRQRLFVIGSQTPSGIPLDFDSLLTPTPVRRALQSATGLKLQRFGHSPNARAVHRLSEVVEELPLSDDRWWVAERLERFLTSLSPVQSERN